MCVQTRFARLCVCAHVSHSLRSCVRVIAMYMKLLNVIVAIPLSVGVHLREQEVVAPAQYSCPAASGFRSDTTLEFYTQTRQFDNSLTINVEIPKTHSEFQCGFINRKIDLGCNCGYFFPWVNEGFRTFYTRSVPFDGELVLFDKFKNVIQISNTTQNGLTPIQGPATLQYALLMQSGMINKLNVTIGDPIQIVFPNGTFFGSGSGLVDDLTGMHT